MLKGKFHFNKKIALEIPSNSNHNVVTNYIEWREKKHGDSRIHISEKTTELTSVHFKRRKSP